MHDALPPTGKPGAECSDVAPCDKTLGLSCCSWDNMLGTKAAAGSGRCEEMCIQRIGGGTGTDVDPEDSKPTVDGWMSVPERVRPAFVASEFDATTYTVVASIADATPSPTPAPTKAPTKAGFVAVAEKVETEAVVTAISFPLTLEEASNKVMQAAMTSGVAASLGLAPTDVTIAKIGGDAVASEPRSRRLVAAAAGIDIEFNIVSSSADAGAVAKLSADVRAAASGGALVANIQKKASDAGVLVASLKAMPRAVVVTTSTVPVTVTVTKQVAAAAYKAGSTPSPSPSDKTAVKKSGLGDGVIAGIAVGVVAFASVVAFVVHAHTKKPTKSVHARGKAPPKPEGPVALGKTEGALGGADANAKGY
jgi:hypothetical protein